MTKIKRNTTPCFKEDPFQIKGIQTLVRSGNKDEVAAVDLSTGELISIRKLKGTSVEVDTRKFVKLFIEDEDIEEVIHNFTLTEWKLWFYIFKQLKPNTNTVCIDIEDCCKYLKWQSTNNYYLGIRGLIEKQILAKTTTGNTMYWVNNNMFFNGDRLKIKRKPISTN